jgi:hypothetical protein
LTGIRLPDKRRIYFLNVYGPCIGRRQFWEKVEAKGLLAQGDLILAGDLNFTTSLDEVWGEVGFIRSTGGFFQRAFFK